MGCCVHVTTLILYLSYSKYSEINVPGEHLNSIFIDFNKKEPPNISKYIRNVRRNNEESSSSSDESECSDVSNVHLEEENNNDEEEQSTEQHETITENSLQISQFNQSTFLSMNLKHAFQTGVEKSNIKINPLQ